MSTYWLGVEFLPVMPALRAQLNLPDKQGLLVERVTAGSPAANAGVQRYDVLLRAGDERLAAPSDLIHALDASRGEKLKIELVRGGKPRTVDVVPALRPEGLGSPVGRPAEPSDWDTIQQWMEGMWGRENGQIGPGQIRLARPVRISSPLPPNMSVVVSKRGDQPARITVERGRQKWEVSEMELDKLPADVRPLVDQLLGRTMFGLFAPAAVAGALRVPSAIDPAAERRTADGSAGDRRLEERLDEIDRRLEKLFQAVDQLRKQREKD
jgi:hypothetical protein